ncbi:MAG TPA: DNA translocase FtsK, partial [Hellea balneolensis]|nr:DNA translocase FtsK [Hellea balneolensis]
MTMNAEMFDDPVLDTLRREQAVKPTHWLRRAVLACLVGGIGAVLVLSILTFSAFDTTMDTVGPLTKPHNFLRTPGANIANWALQFLGWAAFPAGVLLLFAAARAVLRPRLNITRWDTARRSALLVMTVVFLSIFLAAFPIPVSWPFATGIGGWFGDYVFLGLKSWLVGLGIKPVLAGGLLAMLAFMALGYCFGRFLGIVGRDVAEMLDAAGLLWATFRVRLDQLIAFLRRKFQKSHVEPLETAGYTDKRVWLETPGLETSTPAPEPSAPEPQGRVQIDTQPDQEVKPAPTPARRKPARRAPAPKYNFPKNGKFVLPEIDLLKPVPPRVATVDSGALQKSAEELAEVLADFGVKGEIGRVRPGPVVTLYEFQPAPGVKSSRVINLADDIARSMAARSARVAVVPGRNAIGIELPNRRRETVFLREMLASRDFKTTDALLPLALG